MLQYANNLPNAPSGPYFKPKTISTQEAFEKYSKYEVSSLEKSFVWQPHFGRDLGINLDLVDLELMFAYDDANVHPEDMKFLQAPDKFVKKARGADVSLEHTSWLRNTTYSENNLFSAKRAQTQQAPKSKTIRPVADPFSVAVIEASFTDVDKTLQSQIEKNSDKQVEWSVDFLPNDFGVNCPFALVRYDEDPKELVDIVNKEDNGKRTVRRSVLTNARQIVNTDGKTDTLLSLVATADATDRESEDDEDESRRFTHYDWISDFKMEAKAGESDDFLVVVNSKVNSNKSSSSSNSRSAEYYLLQSRIDMRKRARLECTPHDAYISRRPQHD